MTFSLKKREYLITSLALFSNLDGLKMIFFVKHTQLKVNHKNNDLEITGLHEKLKELRELEDMISGKAAKIPRGNLEHEDYIASHTEIPSPVMIRR